MHRKPFAVGLAQQQLAAPYTVDSLRRAADAYGFDAVLRKCKAEKLHKESFPLISWLQTQAVTPTGHGASAPTSTATSVTPTNAQATPALILQADSANVLLIEPGDATPRTMALAEFDIRYLGRVTRITPKADPGADADSDAQERQSRKFGFS
ncbi:MAG: hypothetical protein HYR92_05235 [Burkholderiales bacterium]|nr:hypothetical protein [Burkholderiales bacterium]